MLAGANIRLAAVPKAGRRLLFPEVEGHADQRGALLQGVGRGALQVEADVERGAARPRALDLLAAELLPGHGPSVERDRQLAERPALVGLGVDAVLDDAEAPVQESERLVEASGGLLAGDVLQFDAAAQVA